MTAVNEKQLLQIKKNLKEVVESKTAELQEIVRILNNVTGIQLGKKKQLPKLIGVNQMSKTMREEIFGAVISGCENYDISTKIEKIPNP